MIQPTSQRQIMKGLAKGLSIQDTGTITYHVLDTTGNIRTLKSKAFYVPTATRRIFSPQAYFQHTSTPEELLSTIDKHGINLHFEDTEVTGSKVRITYTKKNILPTFFVQD